jgi:hypothetical protein
MESFYLLLMHDSKTTDYSANADCLADAKWTFSLINDFDSKIVHLCQWHSDILMDEINKMLTWANPVAKEIIKTPFYAE